MSSPVNLLVEDDDFYFHLQGGEVSPITGLIADDTLPFGLYLANPKRLDLIADKKWSAPFL